MSETKTEPIPFNPVKPSAAAQLSEIRQASEGQFMELIKQLDSLDWRKIKPPLMAQILKRVPYRQGRDEPPYFLSDVQAAIFAIESYRMGVSPLSNECFFNRDNNKVNLTLEGKKARARQEGYNFGPPHFERTERDWPSGKTKIPGYAKDIGYTCTMSVYIQGNKEMANYTAWLSEWYMPRSPVWKERTEHMLQTRAHEKCLSSASGVGASELPSSGDIDIDSVRGSDTPQLTVGEFEFKEPTNTQGEK